MMKRRGLKKPGAGVCAIAAVAFAAISALDCAGAVLRPGATEIVVPQKAPNTVMFAAREATNFLSRAFGCEIPVVNGRTPGRTAIFLGDCAESRAAGIDVAGLARDGFVVWSGEDSVCIAGRDDPKKNVDWILSHGGKVSMYFEHATAMGVYWFLEKFVGVRMYFPGELGEVVPRRGSIDVPAGETRVKPDFTSRYYMAWRGEWFEPVDRKRAGYLKTLNYIRLRMETESVPCCHGSIWFNYLRRFGKTHPEYFALLSNGERSTDPSQPHPGQLCWTSGVIEEMYQDVKSYLKGESPSVRGVVGSDGKPRWSGNCSGGKYVDIMPQDAFAGCLCKRCKASYRYIEGDRCYATELIWGVVSNIAARLTAEGIAGTVTMMAYSSYARIPDFELPPNVEVMVARAGPWMIRNRDAWTADCDLIRAWTEKLGHKVWLWNYVNKVGERAVKLAGVPQMSPRAYVQCYKELAPLIRGAFAESETDRYFFNYLNYYVFSKVCWDNSVDVEELLREHHELMFGAGADEMSKIYDALEEKWMGRTVGAAKDTPLGPVYSSPTDAELWDDIYSPEFLAEFDGLMKSAVRKVGEESIEARRIALVRQEFYEPLAASAARYHDRLAAVKTLRHSMKATSPIRLVPFVLTGKEAPEKTLSTEVRVRKDGDTFEVVFDCEEPAMDQRAAVVHEADDPRLWKDDCVEVMVNPSGDMENYYQFVVNSEGSWSDAKLTIYKRADRTPHAHDWNSGMEVKVDRRAGGWTALLRIPLAAFPEVKPEFRAEFARERHVNAPSDFANMYHWSPYACGFHDLENFGTIYDCR